MERLEFNVRYKSWWKRMTLSNTFKVGDKVRVSFEEGFYELFQFMGCLDGPAVVESIVEADDGSITVTFVALLHPLGDEEIRETVPLHGIQSLFHWEKYVGKQPRHLRFAYQSAA